MNPTGNLQANKTLTNTTIGNPNRGRQIVRPVLARQPLNHNQARAVRPAIVATIPPQVWLDPKEKTMHLCQDLFQSMNLGFDEHQFIYNYHAWLKNSLETTGRDTSTAAEFFPFTIVPKKSTFECVQSYEINKDRTSNPSNGTPKQIKISKSTKPNYLVLMPSKVLTAERLVTILNAIRNDSFASDDAMSQHQVKKRLFLELGINQIFHYSLEKNLAFKELVSSLKTRHREWCQENNIEKFATIQDFFWSPWKTKSEFDSQKVYDASISYFLIKKLVPNCLDKLDTHLKLHEFFGENSQKKLAVPYQDIRDSILHSPQAQKRLELFRHKFPKAPNFIASLDADFIQMRSTDLGLYSHYDNFMAAKGECHIVSTGYLSNFNSDPALISYGVHIDMFARKAMTGPAVYYPEPNFICNILPHKTLQDYSWKGVTYRKDTESRRFIENCLKMEDFDASKMFFIGPEGAIFTEIDDAWRSTKSKQIPLINSANIHQENVLTGLLGVKQSHLDSQICANNLYSFYDISFPNNRLKEVIVPLKQIIDVLCPIKLSLLLGKKINNYKEAYSLTISQDFYLNYASNLKSALSITEERRYPNINYLPFMREFMASIPEGTNCEQEFRDLFIQNFQETHAATIQGIYSLGPVNTRYAIDIAYLRGKAIHTYLKKYFE